MTSRGRQLAKLLARILITTALLVWVFRQVDLGQFLKTVRMARWEFLVGVWGLTVVLFWIRSIQMQFILRRQGCDVDCSTVFGATMITALYSLILPGVLSTGVKWYVLKRKTGQGGSIFSGMLYNQLMIMAVMTVFGLAALMVTDPTSPLVSGVRNRWLLPVICGLLLVMVTVAMTLLLSEKAGGKALAILERLLNYLPSAMRLKGRDLLEQIAFFQRVGWWFHLIVVLFIVVGTLLGGVATYILAARSAHIVIPASVLMWLCAIIYVLGRLPISVANLGIRESMLVSFLSLYGVDKPAALLMSMVLFSALVFVAGIGAVYQLRWASTASNAVAKDGLREHDPQRQS